MPKDNPHELFIQVDDQDNIIGQVLRSVAHSNPQIIHRAVVILVFNGENQVLLQKRGLHKDMDPGRWALSCGGHVDAYESYLEAAQRELLEELGFLAKQLKFIKKTHVVLETEQEIIQIYCTRLDTLPVEFDRDEIDQLMWYDWRKIKQGSTPFPLTNFDLSIIRQLPNKLKLV